MTTRRRRAALASGFVSAILAIGLSGCAGESNSEPSPPSSSPPASPSGAQSQSASAEAAAPETAREFIRRWPVVETEMINTGRTEEYRAITQGCEACERLATRVEEIYARGGYAKTAGWVIDSLRQGPRGDDSLRRFVVRTTASSTELRSSAESELERLPGGRITHQITIRPIRNQWRIAEVVELGSST